MWQCQDDEQLRTWGHHKTAHPITYGNMRDMRRHTRHHMTNQCIISHHMTTHQMTSQYITSRYIISHDITLDYITSHHPTWHCIGWHCKLYITRGHIPRQEHTTIRILNFEINFKILTFEINFKILTLEINFKILTFEIIHTYIHTHIHTYTHTCSHASHEKMCVSCLRNAQFWHPSTSMQ